MAVIERWFVIDPHELHLRASALALHLDIIAANVETLKAALPDSRAVAAIEKNLAPARGMVKGLDAAALAHKEGR